MAMTDADQVLHNAFAAQDKGDKGFLTRIELQACIQGVTGQDFTMDHIETLYGEFDKDENGQVDWPEFKTMISFLQGTHKKRPSIGLDDLNMFNPFAQSFATYGSGGSQQLGMSLILNKAVKESKKEKRALLKKVAKELYRVKDILCIQDDALFKDEEDEDLGIAGNRSMALNFDDLFSDDFSGFGSTGTILEEEEEPSVAADYNPMDPDFAAAYAPSDMRCLALVSHNGMKKTMREFVMANKNLLKKFRLTGTNSTMTMLKEVFADEPPGTVVFGPSCASGPLGGDAELVAYMVTGKIGAVIFFQDPMSPHPHRADIDCLVRQALVHNVVMAETPSSALMITQTLRQAITGKGKPELIPSFFFSLQSPTVEAYKSQQKSVVDAQKAAAAKINALANTVM